MWKNLAEWFAALLVTAAVAVSIIGAVEWIEQIYEIVPAGKMEEGKCIVVDAGHGGTDGGAVGTDTGVQEATLNLQVAKRLEEVLMEKGYHVVMTRESEDAFDADKHKDLDKRRAIMNEEQVDIVVSIHMNAFPDRSISGVMAYYMAGSSEGQRLAQCVIDRVCDALHRSRRLANPGDYYVIRESDSPAVLVECGFLSNSEEELLLQQPQHQQILAEAVAEGIDQYFS